MNQFFFITFFLLIAHGYSYGQYCVESSFNLGYTTRRDHFYWTIGDRKNGPNVLSELYWLNISINQVTAFADTLLRNGLYLRGRLDYGRIYKGMNYDADYLYDNREGIFSESMSNAGKGEVFDLSGALGYPFIWRCFKFIPLLGASWDEQHLQIYDGYSTHPFEGKINGLHSSYKARWFGPWLGFDLSWRIFKQSIVFMQYEYHFFLQYRGIGHWNLREEFLSDFKHYSHGKGQNLRLGLRYDHDCNWALTLITGCEVRYTGFGYHVVKIDFPEIGPQKVRTDFNGAWWHSYATSLLLTRFF